MQILLTWEIGTATLASLLAAGYDAQQVQLQAPGPVWGDLLRADQRLPLVAGVERYCLEVGGAAVGTYRWVPVRSSDGTLGTPVAIVAPARRGYCAVADVRAEGYAAPAYPDDRVQAAIDRATATIDRVCGQRFDPHRRRVRLDVDPATDDFPCDQPCIAVWCAWDAALTAMARASLQVYNRHLTQGLLAPDDRRAPRLALTADATDPAWWTAGRQQLVVDGVWGYTDLDGLPGETVAGNGVPLTYGVTPAEIRQACLLLACDALPTLAAGGSTAATAARVLSETTRDQSYTLQALPAAATGWGLTGNAAVDGLLVPFLAPRHLGAV